MAAFGSGMEVDSRVNGGGGVRGKKWTAAFGSGMEVDSMDPMPGPSYAGRCASCDNIATGWAPGGCRT